MRLKKSTLNYLFARLEPAMIVLYDQASNTGYWKWLLASDFDLTKTVASYPVSFSTSQTLSSVDWDEVVAFVQCIFKIKNQLLPALEYYLFQNASEQETKAWAHYFSRQLTEASFYFKRLVQQSNPKFIWFLALAQCQYQMYDYRTALLSIIRALAIDTDDNYVLTRGCILAEDGIRSNDVRKLHKAEKIFDNLYTRSPNATHAYNYANTLSKRKKSCSRPNDFIKKQCA